MAYDGVDPAMMETCSAPTNIAVIKYWGKDSVELNTPLNSSVSCTLDQTDLRAITTVAASREFLTDTLWLNGIEEDVSQSKRFQSCLSLVRKLARDRIDPKTGKVFVKKEEWSSYRIRVVSMNTFPTAAGLASSAAGYACLVYSLAQLFNAEESFPGELSAIARQGSGSACRSLYGGLVRWEKGVQADGLDSKAIEIADANHWPELRVLILVASATAKETPSTSGMQSSKATSELLHLRAQHVVPKRIAALEAAYLAKDFQTFGELTMRDSNQFHATCLDTYPPIFYMNNTSREIIRLVRAFNDACGAVRAAYTFDAGPNAVIYTTQEYEAELLGFCLAALPPPPSSTSSSASCYGITDTDLLAKALIAKENLNPALRQVINRNSTSSSAGVGINMIYTTRVGGGPRRLGPQDALMDPSTGLPYTMVGSE